MRREIYEIHEGCKITHEYLHVTEIATLSTTHLNHLTDPSGLSDIGHSPSYIDYVPEKV
jgi:hypothetical protein